MNFRYISDRASPLREIVARNPSASLDEIRRSHPSLRAMTLDHLALRVDQLNADQSTASLK